MTVLNKAIKYRIYPSKEQETFFAKTFGCARKVYNLMLADKMESYRKTGSFGNQTPAMYKDEYPFLKETDAMALCNAQMNLQAAFRNCFDKKRKKKAGFPKFKSKKRSKHSYTTNNQNGSVAIVDNRYIKLPKVGLVKVKIHRCPEEDWVLKSATISQDSAGHYYASLLFELEWNVTPVPVSDNAIGLDYTSDGLFVDDAGNVGSHHKYYRESQEKLAKEQRKLSRKIGSKKGEAKSNNYLKQQKKVDKIHRHIANQRKDHLHKLSTEIANQYDVVCVEDLDMQEISKGKAKSKKAKLKLGKATMDNGYGMFLNMLEYKLAERGKYFIKVGKYFPSSQLCHRCGRLHPEMKDLKVRTIRCECGLVMDRDHNSAINVKNEGLRLLLKAQP